jgi:outer membrane lipoprotein-sorting protein
MRIALFLMAFLLAQPVAAQQAQFTADDRADVARAEGYLNGLTTLKARFTQIGARGEIAEGVFYLNRPGRLRFEYNPPATIHIVADGLRVIYYDKQLDHENAWLIAATPLAPLLARRVEFDFNAVVRVAREPGVLRITLVDPQRRDKGSITLVFSDNPLELRQWMVIDAQGLSTVIALTNLEVGPALDPDLFHPPERPNPER